jgi:hypothetical protein
MSRLVVSSRSQGRRIARHCTRRPWHASETGSRLLAGAEDDIDRILLFSAAEWSFEAADTGTIV